VQGDAKYEKTFENLSEQFQNGECRRYVTFYCEIDHVVYQSPVGISKTCPAPPPNKYINKARKFPSWIFRISLHIWPLPFECRRSFLLVEYIVQEVCCYIVNIREKRVPINSEFLVEVTTQFMLQQIFTLCKGRDIKSKIAEAWRPIKFHRSAT
jgi:hypothetical protein